MARRPHPHEHLAGAVLGEVEGDLRRRVAAADDEDALTGERSRVAILGAVQQLATIRRLALERGCTQAYG